MEPFNENGNNTRRTSRRVALSELNESSDDSNSNITSPDEMVIVQRGPRRKPLTWSPFEYNTSTSKSFIVTNERTNVETPSPGRPELNLKLRRRLVMTPDKSPQLGEAIAKKLRALPKFEEKLKAAEASTSFA